MLLMAPARTRRVNGFDLTAQSLSSGCRLAIKGFKLGITWTIGCDPTIESLDLVLRQKASILGPHGPLDAIRRLRA